MHYSIEVYTFVNEIIINISIISKLISPEIARIKFAQDFSNGKSTWAQVGFAITKRLRIVVHAL